MSRSETSHSTERYRQLLVRYQELIGKYDRTVSGQSGAIRLSEWLLQHTPDGVAMLRGGKMVTCNRRFHTFCALAPEWRCFSHSEIPASGTLQGVLARAAAWMIDQQQSRDAFHVKPGNGAPPILECSAYEVEAAVGSPRHVALIIRDASDQAQWMQDQRESACRDRFLALLAHELRNPLTPITGAAELLLRSSDDPQVRRAAEIILRQARHQSRMIEDLLDVGRVREGKLRLQGEPVDLSQVVRDAVEATEIYREAGPTLHVSLPEESPWVEGDPTRLVQSVANLLTNAAKFTPPAGSNWLELENGDGIAWVRVRDTGVGIAATALDRIWETFAQEERAAQHSRGGLGLGLSLVKSLVEMHGGGVRAFSEGEGCGTEMTLWLPLSSPPGAKESKQASTLLASKPRRLLIVEDDADSRESLGELLVSMGHRVYLASGVSEAVALALRERPDAILSDLQLSEGDGFAVIAALRPLLPRATYLAMSGYLSPERESRAREVGYRACLSKPISPDQLAQELSAD